MAEEQSPQEESKDRFEVVVGLDFSELSERAFFEALSFAKHHDHAEIHTISVGVAHGDLMELPGDSERISEEHARERAREAVAGLVQRYQKEHGPLPIDRVAVYVVSGDPVRQLTGLARAVDADLIVVGTHGRKGVERLFLGSVAEGVVHNAECGVFVVRPRDFVSGKPVPAVEPPLKEGQPTLHHFEHRRTYHYVDRASRVSDRMMPAT